MIFGCPNCGTDCPVPDDKISGRILKVRCKNCKHIFYIKDPALDEPVIGNLHAPPPPDEEDHWFYAHKSETMGPVSLAIIKRLIETAKIISSTLVWKEGMDNWKPVIEVDELTAIMQATASPTPKDKFKPIDEEGQADLFDFDAQISEDRVELGAVDEEQRIIQELEAEEERAQVKALKAKEALEAEKRAKEEARRKAEDEALASKKKAEEEARRKAQDEALASEKKAKEEAKRKAQDEALAAEKKAKEEAKHKHTEPKIEKGRGLRRRSVEIPAYTPKDKTPEDTAKEPEADKKKSEKASRKDKKKKAETAEPGFVKMEIPPDLGDDKEAKVLGVKEEVKHEDLEEIFNHFDEQRRKQADSQIDIAEVHPPKKKEEDKPKHRMSVMLPSAAPPPPPEPKPVKKSGKVKAFAATFVILLLGVGLAFAFGIFDKPTSSWSGTGSTGENLFIPDLQQKAETAKQDKQLADDSGTETAKQDGKETAETKKGNQKSTKQDKSAKSSKSQKSKKVASASKKASSKAKSSKSKKKQDRLPMAKLGMPDVPDEAKLRLPSSLNQRQITSVVNRNLERIQFCYDTQLRRNPNLSGKVLVNFSISGNGRISTVKIKTPKFRGTYLEGCVRKTMKIWRFPKFSGEPIEVDYPFIFTSF